MSKAVYVKGIPGQFAPDPPLYNPFEFNDRLMVMSDADADAAVTGGWGWPAMVGPTTPDAVLVAMQQTAPDKTAMKTWLTNQRKNNPSIFAVDSAVFSSAIPPALAGGPTNITLSPATMAAASPAGTVVGALGSAGGRPPYVYTLSNNDGNRFALNAAKTGIVAGSVASAAGTRNIQVRVVDANGLSYNKSIAITVT